jgi:hypothetical protein
MSEKDVLCPICGEAVNPNWFVKDGQGRKLHVHCFVLNLKKELPEHPQQPSKPQ